MVPLSKFVNFMAFGLKHEPNTIAGKLLHDTQVTYKARGPLVWISPLITVKDLGPYKDGLGKDTLNFI